MPDTGRAPRRSCSPTGTAVNTNQPSKDVKAALKTLTRFMPALAVISAVVNVLALTSSLYMLQVYDRVLTSRSVPTLVLLSVLTLGLFLFQGIIEAVRGQIFVRLGSRLDLRLAPLVHDAIAQLPLISPAKGSAQQPVHDVDAMRNFLQGQGPIAIFDMPWMPLYLAILFLLHPIIGWVTLGGAAILLSLTLLTEWLVRNPTRVAAGASKARAELAGNSERNAEVLRAMGFADKLRTRFVQANVDHLAAQERLATIVGRLSVTSKTFRITLQSALLGLGAYLTLRAEMTAGTIIACSIIASRALAPIEVAIAHWRAFSAARQAGARLETLLSNLPPRIEPLPLPPPTQSFIVESISIQPPGSSRTTVSNVSFTLSAGQVLAIIGPSAAGKSSLARALAAVWPVSRGAIRLDNAALDRWSASARGRHIGYLPQDVQLLTGTITENIARFEERPDSRDVVAAAKWAGVHEMILRFPQGYETMIGHQGCELSGGQRQRIALARALYKSPFLLVLDEPNSNLDSEGETALAETLKSVSSRGGIAVVIAHRPNVLQVADLVAVMGAGQLTAFGPRDEVLKKVLAPKVAAAPGVTTMAQSR